MIEEVKQTLYSAAKAQVDCTLTFAESFDLLEALSSQNDLKDSLDRINATLKVMTEVLKRLQ